MMVPVDGDDEVKAGAREVPAPEVGAGTFRHAKWP